MPILLKECSICHEMKDSEKEYHSNGQYYKSGETKRRTDCVYCCRKRRSEYFKNTEKRQQINKRRRRNYKTDGGARRERNRINSLMQNYGITVEQYDHMRAEQNYCCAICNIHESKACKGKLYIDHCHKKEMVRALLCSRCNSALGFFDDDINKLEKAIMYIKSKK